MLKSESLISARVGSFALSSVSGPREQSLRCNVRTIPLSQGKEALVDDADYDWLNQWKWRAHTRKDTTYAIRSLPRTHDGKLRISILMHRVITECPRHLDVDHINHNGLDNQRSNLRCCSHRENLNNLRRPGSSSFPGVRFNQGKWRASIKFKNENIHIGTFQTEQNAALAYQIARRHYEAEEKKAKSKKSEFAYL